MYQEAITLHPALTGVLRRIVGYRYVGFPAGTHIGMPSTTITLVIDLDDRLVVSWPTGVTTSTTPRRYDIIVSGLRAGPAHIHHNGAQEGIQLELTPSGARRLFGRPVAEFAGTAVELGDVVGPCAGELREALADEADWPTRYRRLEHSLLRWFDGGSAPGLSAGRRDPAPEVSHAWRLVVQSRGTLPITAIAEAVGWSTRHLGERFRAEYGLTPKTVARVARFDRSHALLRRRGSRIVDVANRCGYADQAHLTREWRELAGLTPTTWWADDDLAFVQDGTPKSR